MAEALNPPAFPSVCLGDPGHPASVPGMSLRDYFAVQALSSVVAMVDSDVEERGHKLPLPIPDMIAVTAYQIADAMLLARADDGGQG